MILPGKSQARISENSNPHSNPMILDFYLLFDSLFFQGFWFVIRSILFPKIFRFVIRFFFGGFMPISGWFESSNLWFIFSIKITFCQGVGVVIEIFFRLFGFVIRFLFLWIFTHCWVFCYVTPYKRRNLTVVKNREGA